jgi:hypothetical protein
LLQYYCASLVARARTPERRNVMRTTLPLRSRSTVAATRRAEAMAKNGEPARAATKQWRALTGRFASDYATGSISPSVTRLSEAGFVRMLTAANDSARRARSCTSIGTPVRQSTRWSTLRVRPTRSFRRLFAFARPMSPIVVATAIPGMLEQRPGTRNTPAIQPLRTRHRR